MFAFKVIALFGLSVGLVRVVREYPNIVKHTRPTKE